MGPRLTSNLTRPQSRLCDPNLGLLQVECELLPLVVDRGKLTALIESSSLLMTDIFKDGTVIPIESTPHYTGHTAEGPFDYVSKVPSDLLQKSEEKLRAAHRAKGSIGEAMMLHGAADGAFTRPDVRYLIRAIAAAEKAGLEQESISAARIKLQSVQSLLAVEKMAEPLPMQIEVGGAPCGALCHGTPLHADKAGGPTCPCSWDAWQPHQCSMIKPCDEGELQTLRRWSSWRRPYLT